LIDYLWIAERQGNGTIHYHMCINQRIDIRRANRFMRAAIMRCIDQKLINWTRDAAKKYNGVDIAKDRKTGRVINFAKQKKARSLEKYLTKYVTKNDGSFKRLAWHCSRGYSELITHVNVTMEEFMRSGFKELLHPSAKLKSDFFEFIPWRNEPPPELMQHMAYCNTIIRKLLNDATQPCSPQ